MINSTTALLKLKSKVPLAPFLKNIDKAKKRNLDLKTTYSVHLKTMQTGHETEEKEKPSSISKLKIVTFFEIRLLLHWISMI